MCPSSACDLGWLPCYSEPLHWGTPGVWAREVTGGQLGDRPKRPRLWPGLCSLPRGRVHSQEPLLSPGRRRGLACAQFRRGVKPEVCWQFSGVRVRALQEVGSRETLSPADARPGPGPANFRGFQLGLDESFPRRPLWPPCGISRSDQKALKECAPGVKAETTLSHFTGNYLSPGPAPLALKRNHQRPLPRKVLQEGGRPRHREGGSEGKAGVSAGNPDVTASPGWPW